MLSVSGPGFLLQTIPRASPTFRGVQRPKLLQVSTAWQVKAHRPALSVCALTSPGRWVLCPPLSVLGSLRSQ